MYILFVNGENYDIEKNERELTKSLIMSQRHNIVSECEDIAKTAKENILGGLKEMKIRHSTLAYVEPEERALNEECYPPSKPSEETYGDAPFFILFEKFTSTPEKINWFYSNGSAKMVLTASRIQGGK